jgi:uncharacterized membrane protein YhaH (DUF805 family)
MLSFMWIEGRTGPARYLRWSLAWLLSQYLAGYLLLRALGGPIVFDQAFPHIFVMPLRYIGEAIRGPRSIVISSLLAAGFLYQIITAWALAALALRRARDAGINEWWATAAFVPPLQPLLILILGLLPSRGTHSPPTQAATIPHARVSIDAFKGACAGIGLTLLAVAMSTLVFGVYGVGLFVLSPVSIGAITAYVGNRRTDIGTKPTWALVKSAAALGGLALLTFALEGLICIIVIAPLWLAGSAIGGVIGRSIAIASHRPPRNTAAALVLLPLVYGLEAIFPASVTFQNEVSINVTAPSAAVWRAIIAMGRVEEQPGFPFRWGLAHPLGGRLLGAGVGAKRYGEFSTGTAVERITEWTPNRRLAFVVLNDVPTVRELSPYDHVHAPHAVGYFRTLRASFEIEDRGTGTTRLTLKSTHLLRLEPSLYWLPFVSWVVEENKARVLRHIRHLAEHLSKPVR